jgi:hypothetical protein
MFRLNLNFLKFQKTQNYQKNQMTPMNLNYQMSQMFQKNPNYR